MPWALIWEIIQYLDKKLNDPGSYSVITSAGSATTVTKAVVGAGGVRLTLSNNQILEADPNGLQAARVVLSGKPDPSARLKVGIQLPASVAFVFDHLADGSRYECDCALA